MAEINIEIEEITEKVNALRKALLDGVAKVLPMVINTFKSMIRALRIKTSRNLQRPTVQVKEHVKREYQRIERTGEIEVPKNYYLLKDDSFSVNEITGAVFNFSFLQLNARRWWGEDKAEDFL